MVFNRSGTLFSKKFDLSEIQKIASENEKNNKINLITNTLSEETVDAIMKLIVAEKKVNNETAWILVTGVIQRGGSNQKAANAVTFNFGDNSLSAKELLDFIRKVQSNATARQFARSIANDIIEIAIALKIPGDLHAQMRFERPTLSDTEAAWCSNFQTSNPNCPDSVRNWLVSNHRYRFNS
jgi:hypothetical protein